MSNEPTESKSSIKLESYISSARTFLLLLLVLAFSATKLAHDFYRKTTIVRSAFQEFAIAHAIATIFAHEPDRFSHVINQLTTYESVTISQEHLLGLGEATVYLGPCGKAFAPQEGSSCSTRVELKQEDGEIWAADLHEAEFTGTKFTPKSSFALAESSFALAGKILRETCHALKCETGGADPTHVDHFRAIYRTLALDESVEVPSFDISVPARSALWAIALAGLFLLVSAQSLLHKIATSGELVLDEPWLVLDGASGIEALLAWIWFIASVAATPWILICLIYSCAASIPSPNSVTTFDAILFAVAFTGNLAAVFSSQAMAADLWRVRSRRLRAQTDPDGQVLPAVGSTPPRVLIVTIISLTLLGIFAFDRLSTEPPKPLWEWVAKTQWSQVTAGAYLTCGLTRQKTIRCWGSAAPRVDSELARKRNLLPPTGEFVAVSANQDFSCAVRVSGELVCFGRSSPEVDLQPPTGQFVDVAVFSGSACARRQNGEVVCWGKKTEDWKVPPGSFVELGVGQGYACGLRAGGTVECWGLTKTLEAQEVPHLPFKHIAVGAFHVCGLDHSNKAHCWGGTGQGVNGKPVLIQSFPIPESAFVSLSSGHGHSCGIRSDGSIACWGPYAESYHPPEGAFSAVSAGYQKACGIRTDGSLTCWGCIHLDSSCDI